MYLADEDVNKPVPRGVARTIGETHKRGWSEIKLLHLQCDNKLSFWHTYHLRLVKELFQQEQVMLALVVVSLGLAPEFVGVVVVSLGLAPEFVGVVVVSLGLVLEFLALVVVVSLVLALVEHCLKVFLSYVLHCVSTVKA